MLSIHATCKNLTEAGHTTIVQHDCLQNKKKVSQHVYIYVVELLRNIRKFLQNYHQKSGCWRQEFKVRRNRQGLLGDGDGVLFLNLNADEQCSLCYLLSFTACLYILCYILQFLNVVKRKEKQRKGICVVDMGNDKGTAHLAIQFFRMTKFLEAQSRISGMFLWLLQNG